MSRERLQNRTGFVLAAVLGMLAAIATPSSAQTPIPPPAGPVTFCGVQAAPTADTYQLIFDGGAPEAVTLTAPDGACPSGATHSFTVPAARFTVGSHTVTIRGANAFGSTTGPTYTVVVGIAPGTFTVTAVLPPAAG